MAVSGPSEGKSLSWGSFCDSYSLCSLSLMVTAMRKAAMMMKNVDGDGDGSGDGDDDNAKKKQRHV